MNDFANLRRGEKLGFIAERTSFGWFTFLISTDMLAQYG